MAIHRVRIARDKAELVQALVDSNRTTGPFQTYADVMVFAAAFGVKLKKRLPLGLIAQEPAPISLEIFISRSYDPVIKLLSTAEAGDTKILSAYNSEAEAQRVEILEEYANGGLETLQEQLKGATNYTERLLLILSSQRSPQPESEEEFDLGRFL